MLTSSCSCSCHMMSHAGNIYPCITCKGNHNYYGGAPIEWQITFAPDREFKEKIEKIEKFLRVKFIDFDYERKD